MWWQVQGEFRIAGISIGTNFVVEQVNGEWIFWRTFKGKGLSPKKKLTVVAPSPMIQAMIQGAINEKWMVPMEEPAWSKALYRPTSWEHLDTDTFG